MKSITIVYQKYFCTIAGDYISSNVVKKYQHRPSLVGRKGSNMTPHKKRDAYKDKLRDEGAADFERQMMNFCVKHMLLPAPATKQPEPDYPFDDLKENTPCRLHPQLVHEGFESYDIDFPTPDGVSVLGDMVELVTS
ncbi:hydroxyproline-rich glycoprotein-like [Oryza sativa Japonica Group]|uniref:Hydroxyproline-rich glycoprotein-like n=1 Tax=Oryza sativa subsp. japonica TaxID=39947 RepID=Q5ZB40_ORYSJ|nr:hydroxyproline-rich glycoprotein-like [Oryza sativa Japonica Group]BAD53182.1 hydroxyproline-rich glycoprotein-like [Oryza sativa Japonica Group]